MNLAHLVNQDEAAMSPKSRASDWQPTEDGDSQSQSPRPVESARIRDRSRQAPPSPPAEKLTLPSIHNLVSDMVDRSAPLPDDTRRPLQPLSQINTATHDQRATSSGFVTVSNSDALPPTPPLHPKTAFDRVQQSPTTPLSQASASNSSYTTGTTGDSGRVTLDGLSHMRSFAGPYEGGGHYSPQARSVAASMSNGAMHRPSLSDEMQGLVQRGGGDVPLTEQNRWQHHHYIAPSSAAAFANQQTERYICPTCNKAFSRPSSLRIHSHSHTGEKPFKCPFPDCGKAFSVRSNMKRHERGCHGGGRPGSL